MSNKASNFLIYFFIFGLCILLRPSMTVAISLTYHGSVYDIFEDYGPTYLHDAGLNVGLPFEIRLEFDESSILDYENNSASADQGRYDYALVSMSFHSDVMTLEGSGGTVWIQDAKMGGLADNVAFATDGFVVTPSIGPSSYQPTNGLILTFNGEKDIFSGLGFPIDALEEPSLFNVGSAIAFFYDSDTQKSPWFQIAPVAAGPVPEPTTMLLFGAGLVGLAGFGRKKFKK